MTSVTRSSPAGVAIWMFLALPCCGSSLSLTGSLNPNDSNDVFLFAFTVGAPASLTIQSYGYDGTGNAPGGTNAAGMVIAPGGFDPYLSLFAGTGPGATFVASNDDGACPPGAPFNGICPDSTLIVNALPAGEYTVALTVFENFSFAENLGGGTLGDGFIGLGDYFDPISGTTRAPDYAIDIISGVTIAPASVPEPAVVRLFLPAGAYLLFLARRRVSRVWRAPGTRLR